MLRTRVKYLPGVLSLFAVVLMCSCGQRKVMMDRAHAAEMKLMNLETDAKTLQKEANDLRKASADAEPVVQKHYRLLPAQLGSKAPRGKVTMNEILEKVRAQDAEIVSLKNGLEKECADLTQEIAAYKARFQKTN